MSTACEIAADYGNAIRDLTCNNKTQINMLTILAEDYKDVSPVIVNVLEKEIQECPGSRKIPLLYVIDSIVKNVPENGQYRIHFSKSIVKIFTHVFEESDERSRALLYKLRQTWIDIFPRAKLYEIDVRLHAIDAAWPLTAVPRAISTTTASNSTRSSAGPQARMAGHHNQTVHVNPKFFVTKNSPITNGDSTTKVGVNVSRRVGVKSKQESSDCSPSLAKKRKSAPTPMSGVKAERNEIKTEMPSSSDDFVSAPAETTSTPDVKPDIMVLKATPKAEVVSRPGTPSVAADSSAMITSTTAPAVTVTTANVRATTSSPPPQISVPPMLTAPALPQTSISAAVNAAVPTSSFLSQLAMMTTTAAPVVLPPSINAGPPIVASNAMVSPGMARPPMMPPSSGINTTVPPPSVPTICNDTPRFRGLPTNNRIFIDGKAYEVIFLCDIPVIIRNGLPHRVSFSGPPRDIMIDGVTYKLAFGEVKTVIIDNEPHLIRFGAPSREFYMRDKPFRGVFGGPPIIVSIDGRRHEIRLLGPPPEAKIEQDPSYELVRFMESVPHPQSGAFPGPGMPMMPGGCGMMMQQPAYVPRPEPPNKSQVSNEVSTLLKRLQHSGLLGALSNAAHKKSADTPSTSTAATTSSDVRNSNSPPIPSTQRLDNIERRATPMSALDQFSMRSLVIRYDSVIDTLIKDRVECPSCGIAIKELYGEAYHQHTAWHMRVFKADTYTRSRPWFMCDDWFTYSETDLANRVTSTNDGEKATDEQATNGHGATSGDALSSDSLNNECYVCNEKFEEYYDEDDDAWKLRDSIVIDGKTCHRYCRTDATMEG